jgi:hypothetical protein
LFCFVLFLEIVTRFVARCCKGLFAKFNLIEKIQLFSCFSYLALLEF